MELLLERSGYTDVTTTGTLSIVTERSKEHVCYTVEDTSRPPGIKVPRHTCIPPGRYRVGISHSNRFNRNMTLIYNCDNGYELKNEGVSFTGIRMHGGNTHKNTDGCPLVAYNLLDGDTIQGTAETEVTALVETAIDAGQEVWIEIR